MDEISKLKENIQKLNYLINFSNKLIFLHDPLEVSKYAADAIPLHIKCIGAIIQTYNAETKTVVPLAITTTSSQAEINNILTKNISEFEFNLNEPAYQDLLITRACLYGEIKSPQDFTTAMSPQFPASGLITIRDLLGIKSVITIPLTSGTKVVGILNILLSNIPSPDLTIEEYEQIKTIAQQIGIALENAQSHKHANDNNELLSTRNKELDTIFEITNEIISTLEPQEVAIRSVNSIPAEMGHAGAVLVEIDNTANISRLLGISQSIENILKTTSTSTAQLLEKLTHNTFPVIKHNSENFIVSDKLHEVIEPLFDKEISQQLQTALNIQTAINVPIKSHNKVTGVIIFMLQNTIHNIKTSDYDLMQILASEIGIGLENAKLLNTYKSLLEELKEKNTQLEAYAQKERDIMDILGHELRTPITIVRNYLSVLLNELQLGKQIPEQMLQEFIQKAFRSTKREMSLLETMLAATKLEAKRIELNKIKVNPVEVIMEAIEGQQDNAQQKGIKIIYIPSQQDIPDIYADRTRIQQIMDNFLNNAVKYTDSGKVEIWVENLKDSVKFYIKDSGRGINKTDIAQLGTKFYRAAQHGPQTHIGETRSINIARPGGTGLGLYVTYELIKLHGGEINVESEVGKGSIFSFTIPTYNRQIETKNAEQNKNLFYEYRKRKLKEKLDLINQ